MHGFLNYILTKRTFVRYNYSIATLGKMLNSTVGTADYKPLDQIFTDGEHLTQSDEKFWTFPSTLQALTSVTTSTKKDIASFVLPLDGALYLQSKLGTYTASGSDSVYMSIYKNNSLYASITVPGTAHWTSVTTAKYGIEGEKGDVFRIQVYSSKSGADVCVGLISLLGSVVKSVPVTITSLV